MNVEKILKQLGLLPLPSQSEETISTLLWAREVFQKHQNTTYAVKDPKGIEELKTIKIGGVDQWLHIRGRNRDNPILLYLHGGPGFPMIGFMDAIQRPWEDYFTVVQWDQRQTGKSYYPAEDQKNPVSLEQFIGDTEEVVQYLRQYLGHEKIFLLGHSWGSVLGIHVVKRQPNWLHAYIGVGQVVNFMENERLLFDRLRGHAREQKKEEVLARLESISPYLDPNKPAESFAENVSYVRTELSRLAGESMMHNLFWDDALRLFEFDRLISPHLTLTDISNAILDDEVAVIRPPYFLTKDIINIDLPNDVGSSFDIPIFFFSGRHDYQVPVTLSDQWFNKIIAPNKSLIHFEESSHMIVNEEPGKFLVSLVKNVLPLAYINAG